MLRISFDFNTETKAVTNVKVINVPSKFDDIDLPVIELIDNKLILSPKAVLLMQVTPGDRIAVNYIQETNEITFPIIGKAEVFTDPNAGNKLSKIHTVSFKGNQREILTKYGTIFTIKEYKPGMFKMISINESDIAPADANLVNENNDLCLI